MSMIHEALKKTGQSLDEKSSMAESAVFRTRSKERRSSWAPILVLAVAALAAVPVVAGRIMPGPQEPHSAPVLNQFAVEEIPAAKAPVFQPPAAGKIAKTPFKLTGIVYAGPASYCIVNGLVLKQGEKVGGATITEITARSVTLDNSGKTVTILLSTE